MVIPRDIIFEIAKWMSAGDLVTMRRVCKWLCESDVLEKLWVMRVDWVKLSANSTIPGKYIDKYANHIRWYMLVLNTDINTEILEKYPERFTESCWSAISRRHTLSVVFIEKHIEKLNMIDVVISKQLPDDFIWRNVMYLPFRHLVLFQKLSEDFIEKYFDKCKHYNLLENQQLSTKFIEKHEAELSLNS